MNSQQHGSNKYRDLVTANLLNFLFGVIALSNAFYVAPTMDALISHSVRDNFSRSNSYYLATAVLLGVFLVWIFLSNIGLLYGSGKIRSITSFIGILLFAVCTNASYQIVYYPLRFHPDYADYVFLFNIVTASFVLLTVALEIRKIYLARAAASGERL